MTLDTIGGMVNDALGMRILQDGPKINRYK